METLWIEHHFPSNNGAMGTSMVSAPVEPAFAMLCHQRKSSTEVDALSSNAIVDIFVSSDRATGAASFCLIALLRICTPVHT